MNEYGYHDGPGIRFDQKLEGERWAAHLARFYADKYKRPMAFCRVGETSDHRVWVAVPHFYGVEVVRKSSWEAWDPGRYTKDERTKPSDWDPWLKFFGLKPLAKGPWE